MEPKVISRVSELPDSFSLRDLSTRPHPSGVLLCSPEEFRVVDVKNPAMSGNIGKVNSQLARDQWRHVRQAFADTGIQVEVIEPLEGREDMVFAANQTFVGLDEAGNKICVPSHMKHPSRRLEVPAFEQWFEARGYRVQRVGRTEWLFEGGGDAIWHPGRGLIWGGYGHRTDPRIYPELAQSFGVPVIQLKLAWDRFYHLDTCFCPLDEDTVLFYPPALEEAGQELIKRVFARVLEPSEDEAIELMACNATPIQGKHVLIQRGARQVCRQLRDWGYDVIELESGEFLKSGGSIYCLKSYLWG